MEWGSHFQKFPGRYREGKSSRDCVYDSTKIMGNYKKRKVTRKSAKILPIR